MICFSLLWAGEVPLPWAWPSSWAALLPCKLWVVCFPSLAAKATCQSCLESTIPTSGVPCGPTGLDAEARAIYTQRVVSWTFTFGHWSKSFVSGVSVGQTRDGLCFALQVGLVRCHNEPGFWCDSADSLRCHNEKTLGKLGRPMPTVNHGQRNHAGGQRVVWRNPRRSLHCACVPSLRDRHPRIISWESRRGSMAPQITWHEKSCSGSCGISMWELTFSVPNNMCLTDTWCNHFCVPCSE